jgi:AraC-like DNA-binding protein
MRASFHRQSFARHSHEGYGVGVIEQGALGFDYRGAHLVAPPGAVNTVNPDEPHTGNGADGRGWAYRMFYFSPKFLQRMAADVAGRPVPLPFFTVGVIDDPALAGLLLQAHALHDGAPALRLGREGLLLAAFARLLARHSYEPPRLERAGREHNAVARVQEHLRGRLAEDVSLAELAGAACLTPYHFIRVFARHTGLTPHAWLMQLRAHEAARLLRQGEGIADAAARTGFADQSHLTRVFKRLLGYTPGQLRNSVQGGRGAAGV